MYKHFLLARPLDVVLSTMMTLAAPLETNLLFYGDGNKKLSNTTFF
jgi:hypothetical protein